MTRVDNAEFIKELTKVLSTNNGKKSVYFTQKRLSPALPLDSTTDATTADLPSNVIETEGNNTSTYPVLIRISMNGKDKNDQKSKYKLSTIVEPQALEQFWQDYIPILRAGFVGLKKKEKKVCEFYIEKKNGLYFLHY
ncbi:uncharacterized protein SPAPADRAFT_146876 [Spathaspora passalidarum NRRL Y-27907]|uniref:Signal recognition particle subunit SRP14 n=1 Tax=Spathaspora passalidarum (strain NRRL Y-27907 / 11-Y1) TaxID=619300 RepID=G3AH99_SPAPN|nr:uncharacterized protein SPAPADRAFT_146876 [Spathaspora passalidarum NRRL Y-27907]EGW35529.1 hypothetical protein SPAPADRAFT_146876 [Spathaspora passalidarum NRRL Y-27907]